MKTQTYIAKGLMIFAGTVLIIAGIIVFLGEPNITTKFVLDKIIFFLSGGVLIFLGARWKGKQKD